MDSIGSRIGLAGLVLLVTAGCGSLINGSTQQIGIQSDPSGASIAVDGVRNAETPAMLSLSRKSGHALQIELDGSIYLFVTLTPDRDWELVAWLDEEE